MSTRKLNYENHSNTLGQTRSIQGSNTNNPINSNGGSTAQGSNRVPNRVPTTAQGSNQVPNRVPLIAQGPCIIKGNQNGSNQIPNRVPSTAQGSSRTGNPVGHHIDLYAILGITSEATKEEIEEKYDELCRIYHPDNVKTRHREQVKIIVEKYKARGKNIPSSMMVQLEDKLNDRVKDAVITFNLINQAYSKLSKEREVYDAEYKQFQDLESDFVKMKDGAESFMKSQRTTATDDDILKKKKMWEDMNKKHNFNETMTSRDVVAMDEKETNLRMDEIRKMRTLHDDEDKPELIFDPKNINNDKFNALFEKMYKKNTNNKGELMEASGPMPAGLNNIDQYCNLKQFDQVYAEDDMNLDDLSFSAADFSKKARVKITQKDLDGLTEEDYVERKDKKLTDDDIKKYEADRSAFETQRDAWTMKDYSTDVMYGGLCDGLEQGDQVYGALEFVDKQTKDHYRKFITKRDQLLEQNNKNKQEYFNKDEGKHTGYSAQVDSSRIRYPAQVDSSRIRYPTQVDSSRIGYPAQVDSSRIGYPAQVDSSRIGYPAQVDSSRIGYPAQVDSSRIGYPAQVDSSRIGYPSQDESTYEGYPSLDRPKNTRSRADDHSNEQEYSDIREFKGLNDHSVRSLSPPIIDSRKYSAREYNEYSARNAQPAQTTESYEQDIRLPENSRVKSSKGKNNSFNTSLDELMKQRSQQNMQFSNFYSGN
jgi:curved DNA-binding protein CbpA